MHRFPIGNKANQSACCLIDFLSAICSQRQCSLHGHRALFLLVRFLAVVQCHGAASDFSNEGSCRLSFHAKMRRILLRGGCDGLYGCILDDKRLLGPVCLDSIDGTDESRGDSVCRVDPASLQAGRKLRPAAGNLHFLIRRIRTGCLIPANCNVLDAPALCIRDQNGCDRHGVRRARSLSGFSLTGHRRGRIRDQKIPDLHSICALIDEGRLFLPFEAEGRQNVVVALHPPDGRIRDAIAGTHRNSLCSTVCSRTSCRAASFSCRSSGVRVDLHTVLIYGGSSARAVAI